MNFQLKKDKVELENQLEQEQEALVNRLWKRMDKLEAEKRLVVFLNTGVSGANWEMVGKLLCSIWLQSANSGCNVPACLHVEVAGCLIHVPVKASVFYFWYIC